MRHAHAVHFSQDVVRQVVFLIEPDRRRGSLPTVCLRSAPGMSQSRPAELASALAFRASENVPFQCTCGALRRHAAAFQKALSLYSRLIFSSETGQRRNALAAPNAPCRQPP